MYGSVSSYVDPVTALRSGEVLANRFQVESLARRGGMGAIFRGVDLPTAEPVAIKIMGSVGPGAQSRFLREAQILEELSHDSVVRYVAHGTTDGGVLYLVMEWLEGEDLAERLSKRRLDLRDSLQIAVGVCRALETAHARGVVHRDIKPANLFLCGGAPASVKVLDFGVARLKESAQAISGTGSLIGTVGYMAPEQAMCEDDVDARADVFAIGCVLYECLTGVAPFSSNHPVGVLAKVLREDPPRPSEVHADIDPRVDGLLAALLAKKREERPLSAGAVVALVERLERQLREDGPMPSRRPALSARSERRVMSVILGRPSGRIEPSVDRPDEVLAEVARGYSAELSPLKGGAVLIVLTAQGEANDRASLGALCALKLAEVRPDFVFAVATGLADTSDRVPVGAAIDRAAALIGENASLAHGVLMDNVTAGLVGLRFDVVSEGSMNVLVGAKPDLDAPRLLMGKPTPYVGRDRQLSMLDAMLDECISEGVTRTVLVTGEPGIGKSRLASEWLARNKNGAVRTLFARAHPGSSGSAFSLVLSLVRHAAALREADHAEVQRASLAEHVARLSPNTASEHVAEFLSEMLGISESDQASPVVRAARRSPEIMREQMRRTLHAWLDGETAAQPVIMVLEDLHWGDAPSVSFLIETLRERKERALLIVALGRPAPEGRVTELAGHATLRLHLDGLSARAVQQLVRSALPHAPDQAVLDRIIKTADGNPFYVEELIRRVASGSTEWPDTVLAMAQSRIEQLEPAARHVLRAASVFGEACWDRGLEDMLGDDLDVRRLLESLASAELLLRAPESRYPDTTEYRFRHALLRDAAYAMMNDEDRRTSHGIAGDWLERKNEKDARVLSDHFETARLDDRARRWLLRAAKSAIEAGDARGAIAFANRGVALGATGLERGQLLLSRGYAEGLIDAQTPELVREALDLLGFGTASWWLGLAVLIFGCCMRGRPEEAAPHVKLATQAPFIPERHLFFGQGLITLVGGLILLGKGSLAESVLDRASQAATDYGERDPIFDAFLHAARCALASMAPLSGKWRLEEAYHEGRRAASTLGTLGALHGQALSLYYFSVAAMHVGRHEEAREAATQSVDIARRIGIHEGWPLLFLGKALLRLGKPEEAMAAVAPLRSSADWTVSQMLPIIVAEGHLRLGDLSAAAEEAAPACRGTSPRLSKLAACVLARAHIGMNEPARALSVVAHAMSQETSDGLESDVDLMTLRAEALMELGEIHGAREAITRAREAVFRIGNQVGDLDLRESFFKNMEPCVRALELHARWCDGAPQLEWMTGPTRQPG
ncbi:MAG TPA: protein kinase [Polyangiaceae bacterium]|nr:protein kinase [Polyangiaceae bacterium]